VKENCFKFLRNLLQRTFDEVDKDEWGNSSDNPNEEEELEEIKKGVKEELF